MKRVSMLGIALALAVVVLPGAAGAKCIYNGSATIACTPYVNVNVVVLGATFNPRELTVEHGAQVLFQNFDAFPHTATIENAACRATAPGSPPCHPWFDVALPANARLNTAQKLFTNYLMPGDYNFYCKYHSDAPGEGMTGILHVLAL